MKSVFVTDLKPGSPVIREWFLLAAKECRLTSSGKPYVTLTLADRTGKVEAKIWDCDSVAASIDDFVKVEATVGEYQGRVQLTVSRIRTQEPADQVDAADFFPCSKRDRGEMFGELVGIVADHTGGDIRFLLERVIYHSSVADRIRNAPAAMTYHHAYIGGLLEHILSIAGAAIALAPHYGASLEVLIAGAILHDIGKLWELEYERGTRYSVAGRLEGHIPIGYSFVERIAAELGIAESPDVRHVLHIILSHHGTKEHGAAAEPATREAFLFHMLDLMDSRMAAIAAAAETPDEDERFFYVPAMRTRFVRRGA